MARLGKRVGTHELPLLLPQIQRALKDAPFEAYVRWLVEKKLPKKPPAYRIDPPLFVNFAADYQREWADWQEAKREAEARAAYHSAPVADEFTEWMERHGYTWKTTPELLQLADRFDREQAKPFKQDGNG
jgi:hypothetical protein